MKLSRSIVVSLAVAALMSGCGSSSNPTNVTPLDTSPPPTPTSLTLVVDGSTRSLTWAASTAPDVAGYDVYAYQPDPERDNSYIKITSLVGVGTSYVLPAMWSGDGNYFRVVAVDNASNASGMSTPLLAVYSGPAGTLPPPDLDPTEPVKRK